MKDKEHGDKGENEDLVDVISERMQILKKKKKRIFEVVLGAVHGWW